ncbi:MAG: metallophosphoesterase family protein [Chloroflexi bacterium]|nr:metallophosphoesterase family protein [Chloroflexota bacterium]
MRILIFSDLHANSTALAALQSAEQKPDALFFLGDAVGYGPDSAECVAWVERNATVAVRGDHDYAAATGADCASPAEWRDLAHATRDLNRAVLSRGFQDFLAGLEPSREIEMGGARFRLCHQLDGAGDGLTASDAALEKILAGSRADVTFYGHTHIPSLRRVGNQWLVNPGSLGQPRHGLPSATYAVWQDGDLKIQHIDYDPRAVMQRLALLPLDPEYIVRLQQTLARGM